MPSSSSTSFLLHPEKPILLTFRVQGRLKRILEGNLFAKKAVTFIEAQQGGEMQRQPVHKHGSNQEKNSVRAVSMSFKRATEMSWDKLQCYPVHHMLDVFKPSSGLLPYICNLKHSYKASLRAA